MAQEESTVIFVFGASGDLALKKTYPSLYELYLSSLLPARILIVGYGRSSMQDEEARGKWGKYLKAGTAEERASFLKLCTYRSGGYNDTTAFKKVGASTLNSWKEVRPLLFTLTASPAFSPFSFPSPSPFFLFFF